MGQWVIGSSKGAVRPYKHRRYDKAGRVHFTRPAPKLSGQNCFRHAFVGHGSGWGDGLCRPNPNLTAALPEGSLLKARSRRSARLALLI